MTHALNEKRIRFMFAAILAAILLLVADCDPGPSGPEGGWREYDNRIHQSVR
jgi:hypothetical protein